MAKADILIVMTKSYLFYKGGRASYFVGGRLEETAKLVCGVLKLVRKAIADLLKIMAMNQAFNCFAYTLINWHNLLGLPSTLCFPSFQFFSQFRWAFQLSLSFSLSFWSFPNLLCKFSI